MQDDLFKLQHNLRQNPRQWRNTLRDFSETAYYKAKRDRYVPLTWMVFAPLGVITILAIILDLHTWWFWLFLALTVGLIVRSRRTYEQDALETHGFWGTTGLVVTGGLAIFWRISPSETAWEFAIAYVVISLTSLLIFHGQKTEIARASLFTASLLVFRCGRWRIGEAKQPLSMPV